MVRIKFFALVPVLGAALLGMVLSQLAIGDPVTGQQPKRVTFDEVTVSDLAIAPEYEPGEIPKEEGAGYKPPVQDSGECVCPCEGKCLDEAAVRKIVQDEFDKQCRAEQVAPRSSIPGAVGYSTPVTSSPVVTYSSPTVTYSSGNCSTGNCGVVSSPYYAQPTTTVVRQGVFGRRVYQSSSSGTCRMVNGRMVCN